MRLRILSLFPLFALLAFFLTSCSNPQKDYQPIQQLQVTFKQAILNTEEYQILTAGSDRKITYWEKYDGQIIRSIEGSQNELNTLDITAEGKHFISGGQDGRLRIWNYDEGICYFEG